MSQGTASELSSDTAHDAEASDDKYLVRNRRQIRRLLEALIEQRSVITAHLSGRDQSFPTALLEVDEDGDWLRLDGSPNEASNRAAEQASYLLCFAQLSQVKLRFRVEQIERLQLDQHVAFRAPLPETLHYLQRRECYRLETPITDAPVCTLQLSGHDEKMLTIDVRVTDISAGGMAIALMPGMPQLTERRTYPNCQLALPDQAPISFLVTVCSQSKQAWPSGLEYTRVGLQFCDLPRGADEAIQRYIFHVDRQRRARTSGVF